MKHYFYGFLVLIILKKKYFKNKSLFKSKFLSYISKIYKDNPDKMKFSQIFF